MAKKQGISAETLRVFPKNDFHLQKKSVFAINDSGGNPMKSWQDLKLTDDYLFSQIMREEDFCKLFLEMLMRRPRMA